MARRLCDVRRAKPSRRVNDQARTFSTPSRNARRTKNIALARDPPHPAFADAKATFPRKGGRGAPSRCVRAAPALAFCRAPAHRAARIPLTLASASSMGFKCGIVGLPNVGKSTLFNALTQTAAAQAANYPFCTIEPNVGDVAVPDPRLETLARDRQLEGDHPDAPDLRRHRRPGARRLEGRGSRQPVPRQHPRVRRDRPCRALFRGRRRHPCRRPHRPALRHRDDRDRTDARRSRKPRAARRRDGEEGQGRRQGGQGPATSSPSAASPNCARAGPRARPA